MIKNERRFLAQASVVAIALASVSVTASAATYFVSNATELVNAVNAANASADVSATIIVTQSFVISGPMPNPAKPITLDTQGFTITGGAVSFGVTHTNGNVLTLSGQFRGGNSAGAGGIGFNQSSLIVPTAITNNGSIAGGASTGATGGVGLNLAGVTTFINNGAITGGSSAAAGNSGGTGAQIRRGSSLANYGTIQGGSNTGGFGGGAGIDLGGPGDLATLTNYGMIRGGSGAGNGGGALGSGTGVFIRNGGGQIVNTGVIEGGNNAAAIITNSATIALNIINSGAIRANGSATNAIAWLVTPTTGSLNLELQPGSVITGNVLANQAGANDILRLGGSGNWTLDGGIGSAGQYRNFDTLEKTGAGAWTIAGSGDFTGATTISEGVLIVNGSLANSAVTVQSGATLGGSGAVGATTIASGGRITPGNSIGTITVNGAYAQSAGSIYQVELDPATTTSDRIQVNGAATLASGAGLSVVNYTGANYVAGQRFTILTSTGLTGTYGLGDQVLTPFLNLRDVYDANNAYLTVVQTRSAADVGSTGNEAEVGKAVDSLPTGNPVQNDVLNQASIDAARRALNQMSGEIHASAKTALIDESWLLRAAVNDRLRSAFGGVGATQMAIVNYGYAAETAPSFKGPAPALTTERFSLWGQAYGSWGRTSSDGNAARLTRSTGGFLFGADMPAFDNLRFGMVAGYSRSSFDVTGRLSSGESDNYHLGLYAGGQWGAINLRAGASYTWHDIETSRTVVSAAIGGNPRADYRGATAQLFGEAGYRMAFGGVALEPFAGLTYLNLRTDSFSETGGATALIGRSDDSSIGYSTVGLRASTSFDLQGMAATLRGGLAWRRAFGDVNPTATLAFADSSAFTVAGLPIARDSALVEAGLDISISDSARFGVAYIGQLAESAQDHGFKGVLAIRF